jgi:hypothetical protein
MIEVWHAIEPTFGVGEGVSHYPNGFKLIAVINTDSLGEAFRLSNTIEQPWWTNDGVSVMAEGDGFRNTSVGDVLVTRDYKLHVVMPAGFKTLPAGPQFIKRNLYEKDDA